MLAYINRLTCVLLLVFTCTNAAAQQTDVKKSKDIVVIKGESYYLHMVEEGQTLYSICKAYDVDINTVKTLNNMDSNAIKLFDVLKIPYVAPFTERDASYYYHRVEKGETLYSISKHYGIKVREILKENKDYEHTPLSIGAVVRLPLQSIDTTQIGHPVAVPVRDATATATDGSGKSTAEPQPVVPVRQETNPFKTDSTSYSAPVSYGNATDPTKRVKVALLLPLFAQENIESNRKAMLSDNESLRKSSVQILHKSEQFLSFYEGTLLALDSLKTAGYQIDLYTFDTRKDNYRIYEIAGEINTLSPDLIIGPVYESEFKSLMENLKNQRIPVVYPLSSRNESLGNYPQFVQMNTSTPSLADDMSTWIAAQASNANIICIHPSNGYEMVDSAPASEMTEGHALEEKLDKMPDVVSYKWGFSDDHSETLKTLLNPEGANLIVLPTSKESDVIKILPTLTALAEQFRIEVVGLPDWQNFTAVDHEMYYKLDVKIFTPSYVDNTSDAATRFADHYRSDYFNEPHSLAAKAFDMSLFFIPLVARYRENTLEALSLEDKTGFFTAFGFRRICPECGWENRGLFIVNYSSNYRTKITRIK